ncbi:GatB/YqeY domain-containing protein [Saccharopolyspora rhizosphaerae]|uniref:GatB/YqeY domain-containing protein n=1 Tax=Saccharopolyspora rhizosphaerae TaxID=2492662 RepID=A0A426JPC2_9PSEU|nr:GatB/YqeY domain-containing protein [Saccharopolyspora rhizosphaerae]RRO15073.1 GatB/YqeY domain-containing protein [Saccharopolyspora rhizosphaerae]
MAELKEKLRADLSAAMKQRDTAVTGVLRMALAAVGKEEVSGKQQRELSDEEVLKVLGKEAKKRDEAAEAFRAAGRDEQADSEAAEAEVLRRYLPQQLSDDELSALVAEAIAEVEAELGERPGMKQMGQVMKVANAKAAGRAEGGKVAGLVKSQLQG